MGSSNDNRVSEEHDKYYELGHDHGYQNKQSSPPSQSEHEKSYYDGYKVGKFNRSQDDICEGGMPPGVIKHKQKLDAMEPHELHAYFKTSNARTSTGTQSVEYAARKTAWRHGYGEMSGHYWNKIKDIKEDVMNELSRKTLSSYIKKATDDVSYHSFTAGSMSPKDKDRVDVDRKSFKRQTGVGKAADKLGESELKKFVGGSKGSMKRKYLGAMRGRTATGQPAHPIEIDPVLKTNTDINKVVK